MGWWWWWWWRAAEGIPWARQHDQPSCPRLRLKASDLDTLKGPGREGGSEEGQEDEGMEEEG